MPPADPLDQALDEAATALYALRPDEFTAARNARAQTVAADDRELAARIRELRRPSPAAWLVNQLVRHRPVEVEAVLDLGAEARETQGRFDATELAELGRQRRRLVSALAHEAGALAEELGSPVRTPVLDEVAQTLQAAMSDAAAADAVRTGRLVRALEAVGVEVDLSDAVAGGPVPSTAPELHARASEAPHRPSAAESKQAEAARKHAERTVATAEERAAEASAALEALDARLADADRERRDLTSRRDELDAELRRVETEIAESDRATRTLTRERDRAARDAEAAEVDADEAREALETLE
ncbi:vacuolar-type H+-ATPase subunit I/STV1 [Agromyces cerinus]|uniref:transposase n=1 Tax=Agromyces cerinus TaxID=33878 RepID=UPI00195E4931|nr:transposase [Agromyces cerinus]MBM7831575.1 vacuolar-type H+-ATPase subunit I/STV1 [Agromyces cerinus]